MIDTLIDEETELRCGDKSHTELAVDFAKSYTGLSEREIAAVPLPLAVQDMNHFRLRVSRDEPLGIALAVLGMGGESDFSRTCAALADGLRRHYGVRDEDQQSWIVHIEGDVEHGATAERLSRKLVRGVEDQRRCLELIAEYQDRWQYFFGLSYDPDFVIRRSALVQFRHLWS
jgi:pyrroloquinoline quinone (PQQ) biosynthesis protein C